MKGLVSLRNVTLLSALFLIVISDIYSQQVSISGVVIDADTNQSIPFANVAIRSKFIGTVTDSLGRFLIESNIITESDTIEISSLGYKKVKLALSELNEKDGVDNFIVLNQQTLDLEEFTISSEAMNGKKIYGSDKAKSQFAFAFNPKKSRASENFGREVAMVANLKHKSAVVNNVSFFLGNNQIENLTMRVNIYGENREGIDQPGNKLFEKVVTIENSPKGKVKTDFLSDEIIVTNIFWVSVEFLNYKGDQEFGIITVPVSFPFGKMYTRESSLGEWKQLKGVPSIQVEVENFSPQ